MKTKTLSFLCLFITAFGFAQVSQQEKQILLDLHTATNGLEWNIQWDLETPVETWHGITVTDNKITGINLLFNNLNGTLPASLGQLKSLKKLELSFNPISGTIPAELGNLSSLEILAINGTALSGSLPASLGNLSKLKQLHLSSNQLSGTVPDNMGNLEQIEIFNVFDNDLAGVLPKGLAKCRNLKELVVAENNFTNADDFSVALLSTTGTKINLEEKPNSTKSTETIIAVERNENVD